MKQGFEAENKVDKKGFPAGGTAKGKGIDIRFQNGPLADMVKGPLVNGKKGPLVRGKIKEPNGAFVEDLIDIVIQRIEFYQKAADGKFYCGENVDAIRLLKKAGERLADRTKDRENRKVEGTHEA